jgi:hypothetical protein
MPFDGQPCRHQLDRPPALASGVEGVSCLVFECVLCVCEVSLRLNSEGEIDGEFIVPPSSKRAGSHHLIPANRKREMRQGEDQWSALAEESKRLDALNAAYVTY